MNRYYQHQIKLLLIMSNFENLLIGPIGYYNWLFQQYYLYLEQNFIQTNIKKLNRFLYMVFSNQRSISILPILGNKNKQYKQQHWQFEVKLAIKIYMLFLLSNYIINNFVHQYLLLKILSQLHLVQLSRVVPPNQQELFFPYLGIHSKPKTILFFKLLNQLEFQNNLLQIHSPQNKNQQYRNQQEQLLHYKIFQYLILQYYSQDGKMVLYVPNKNYLHHYLKHKPNSDCPQWQVQSNQQCHLKLYLIKHLQ